MYITRECDYAVRVIRALEGEKRLSVGPIRGVAEYPDSRVGAYGIIVSS